ncbi:MAG TPA: response regulator [Spirochaetota bacterium]|nr:response regulator [Spirochaetota bacterium]HOS39941.1 response regulator [Spirochaetota bacterium]HPI22163.1 response regulator [Spirochaetota bacterium]
MKVYIVEDAPLIRGILIDQLRNMKSIELCGFSHESALAIGDIREIRPDLVVLDIQLYNGNGIEVLKEFQFDPARPTFVVLTNYPYAHYRERCRQLGVDYFFDKSLELSQAIDVIRERAGAVA